MQIRDLNRLNIAPRLTFCFALIIFLMLAGNALLFWQFHVARVEADHVSGVSQELIAVVGLQTTLLNFDDALDKLAQSEDVKELSSDAEPLRRTLLEATQQAKDALAHLPGNIRPDPMFLPTTEAIESTLPSQLEAISALAASGDWGAIRLRVANEKKPLESQTSALVKSINQAVNDELAEAVANIRQVQSRMLLILPATTLFTFLIAGFFGLVITRSIADPLGKLMEGSRALARGEFQHQVIIDGQDELAQLGQVFNDTAGKLRSLYESLQAKEVRLAEAQRLSHTGSWTWSVPEKTVFWSEETFRIFEIDPGIATSTDLFISRVHPDDRGGLQTMESALLAGREAEYEYRIVLPNGSTKHIRSVAHPVKNQAGEVVEFMGTVIDETEPWNAREKLEGALEQLKQRTEALQRSEAYLAEAQTLAKSGSWAWDVHTGVIFWSDENYRIYGYDPNATKPTWQHILDRAHPDDRAAIEERAKNEAVQTENAHSEGDYRIILPDGRIKHLHSIAHSVRDESGHVVEVVGTTMDVTEQWNSRNALERAFEEIKTLKDQLHQENIALREEIDKVSMFEEIVGSSEPLRRVLTQVAKVAATESTVLITGETGTGKEMIARAIHRRSNRAGRAFIRVNCAAIPPTLIASELFGHEKGAFTGAVQRRVGRFESADGGTIFLDEIGELPAETQSALLRVLQEREFERVGGTQSISVDVRVLSATNRDLKAAVQGGIFRQDLFYRLNVFPIHLPPLRQRVDDIPLLIEYLIERYSKKAGKRIRSIEKRTMELFQAYPWPGNIRELQNVVERAVVLCDGDTFFVDETWLKRDLPRVSAEQWESSAKKLGRLMPDEEKKIIETALADCGGRVAGARGAAALLGVPRQTLESKIAALGIDKYRFKSS
jgi:PAS domain S-box-containing protein